MKAVLSRLKKKYTLALLFWASGTWLAFDVEAGLGEYTAFTAIVCGLFKAADVADKRLNGGKYDVD